METVVKIKNLKKIYKMGDIEVDALRGVNLSVKSGDFISIIGPSGSGKSTLLNMIGVLDTPTSGELSIDGVKISTLKENQIVEIRRKVGFVFQFFNLIQRLNARENVELALSVTDMPKDERKRRAEELLELVGLADRMEHKPSELSGGQRQRVAVARALANKPKFLLMDEPTGNIDSKTAVEVMALIDQLNKENKATIILVTHDKQVAEYADKTYQMCDGIIKEVSE
ncbi:MAG: ABC transporter ATP-binding protein [Candidatus Ranarchaeia archaeon]